MITKEIAVNLHVGKILFHKTLKNGDGSRLRCRVNGKCKTWKRNPNDFRLPVKYGLRECFYIYPNVLNGIRDSRYWDTEERR